MMLVFLAIMNVTLLAAIMFNAPLEEAANAAVTPNPAKAPWYFVWLQELVASTTVRSVHSLSAEAFLGGILLPGFLLVVLAVWPWLDRSPKVPRADGFRKRGAIRTGLRRRQCSDSRVDPHRGLSARAILEDLLARLAASADAEVL